MDLEKFNAEWLKAWSDKDIPRLVAFYTDDCIYKDPQVARGLSGQGELDAYLTRLFGAMPPTTYTPEEIWPTHNGYCGRWYARIGANGEHGRMRGFDLVVLKDGKIALNEVYVHQLPA